MLTRRRQEREVERGRKEARCRREMEAGREERLFEIKKKIRDATKSNQHHHYTHWAARVTKQMKREQRMN